jgi:hypothetical protein
LCASSITTRTGSQRGRYAGREQLLADLEHRALRPVLHHPVLHLVRPRGTDRGVVERHTLTVEHDPIALCDPDMERSGRSRLHLRGVHPSDLKCQDLSQPTGPAGLQYDVTARLEREVDQGGLELEAAAVDRTRERKNTALDHPARGAEVGNAVRRRDDRRRIWRVLRWLHAPRLSPSVRRRLTHSG